MSHVTCHLSLTPTATARDPPPANSPIMNHFPNSKIYSVSRFKMRMSIFLF